MIHSLKLNVLLGIFVGLLIGMNLLGAKIITVLGVSVSVGIFMVPITFLITDIVAEVFGKKIATQFLVSGVIALLMIFVYTWIFVQLSPNERYTADEAYKTVFESSLRIIIASVVAFVFSQFHDIVAFEWWKTKTKGKMLWLRNNMSTFISQAIDTFIFMMLAFYQMTPKFDFGFVMRLAIPFYIFKLVFAVIDTPFVYLGVRWLRPELEKVRSDGEYEK